MLQLAVYFPLPALGSFPVSACLCFWTCCWQGKGPEHGNLPLAPHLIQVCKPRSKLRGGSIKSETWHFLISICDCFSLDLLLKQGRVHPTHVSFGRTFRPQLPLDCHQRESWPTLFAARGSLATLATLGTLLACTNSSAPSSLAPHPQHLHTLGTHPPAPILPHTRPPDAKPASIRVPTVTLWAQPSQLVALRKACLSPALGL